MGRQVHLHMLREDRDEFLKFAQSLAPIVLLLRAGPSPLMQPVTADEAEKHQHVYLWNRAIAPHLRREWRPDPGFYGISVLQMPLLELGRSLLTTWQGKSALAQGRLYGVFDQDLEKPPDFVKWYERLARWFRKNYRKAPTGIGGYVGPAAYQFYEKGGYLLPNFRPPATKEWVAEIGKQHR